MADATAGNGASSPKGQFLEAYDREHAVTMRVLRSYPEEKLDLRPHPKCKTARELAWIFVLERGLGMMVFQDQFGKQPMSASPPPPESWTVLLDALEGAHRDFGAMIRGTSEGDLGQTVKFLTGPKTVGDVRRLDFAWFMLCDQIHHRGQFSIYLRMADAKVPAIYGPSADEPWI